MPIWGRFAICSFRLAESRPAGGWLPKYPEVLAEIAFQSRLLVQAVPVQYQL
jgi:hypothetical protein